MKFATFFLALLYAVSLGPDISQVRQNYREASRSGDRAKQLYDHLASVTKDDDRILVAYKGAVTTLMAKYTRGIKQKKTYFKEGMQLLELAVAADPKNTEIRYIRLSVQENSPKIVGYKQNIEEDKQFILDHYQSMTDNGAKKFIKGYVSQSEVFNEAEKQLF